MSVRLTVSGDVIEVARFSCLNKEPRIKNLNKDEYVNLQTGEILQKNHAENRAELVKSLKRTFKGIRDMVNSNCTDPQSIRWLTLTYAENMQDYERLYPDFKAFIRTVRSRYGNCEYIVVPEPQARGAWHLHVILVFEGKAPFMPNADVAEIWGNGFVSVKAIHDCNNIGAYLSAYLGDLEVPLGTEGATDKTVDGQSKAFLKGARLKLYPSGMRMYRASRGIKRPVVTWIDAEGVEEEVKDLEPIYHVERNINCDGEFSFKVSLTYYNRKVPHETESSDKLQEHGCITAETSPPITRGSPSVSAYIFATAAGLTEATSA